MVTDLFSPWSPLGFLIPAVFGWWLRGRDWPRVVEWVHHALWWEPERELRRR